MTQHEKHWPRRRMLGALTTVGVGSAVFSRALLALAEEQGKVTPEMIEKAEWIAGLSFTDEKRKMMAAGVNDTVGDYEKLRAIAIDNGVAPALRFDPAPAQPAASGERLTVSLSDKASRRPDTDEDLAFAPLSMLAGLIRRRKISSVELTKLYLARLKKYDPTLHCVITLTEELALSQAAAADREIALGNYRGPLHGIPWGAKDLLAMPGYKTTWGSVPYKEQVRPEKAAVISRLEEAGAVLAAKTAVGELAWGDVWFDAMTRNPWNTEQGSSGSSAGSASATAAGLVGFAIGTETLGSIVSPCTRCGCSGLRPTFGRVSRHGAMALSWSMDKVGPIARRVEDCAAVFGAIHGRDVNDPTSVDRPFEWPAKRSVKSLRVGYVEDLFDEDRTKYADAEDRKESLQEWMEFDRRTLQTLKDMGLQMSPMKLPSTYPVGSLSFILSAEAAAAFDEVTRSGKDDTMVRQVVDAWPNVFRQGQMVPAVEYIRANRIRTLVMREMEQIMSGVDVYVCPSYGGSNLLLTNLTGHPSVVLPNGFHKGNNTPTSITFIGQLYGEAELLAVAMAYQEATDFHLKRPNLA